MSLDPDSVPDLIHGLCFKDCVCTMNPLYYLAKTSKFSMLLVTRNLLQQGISQAQGVALRGVLGSRGDPGVQPPAMQKSSVGPGLSTSYGVG